MVITYTYFSDLGEINTVPIDINPTNEREVKDKSYLNKASDAIKSLSKSTADSFSKIGSGAKGKHSSDEKRGKIVLYLFSEIFT